MEFPRLSSLSTAVVALLAPFMASCNLLIDTSGADQCVTDNDCTKRGGAFAGTLCAKDAKICVSATNCSSHRECSERIGEASYCRPADSVCSRLLTEDCTEIWPTNWRSQEELLMVGFMAPLVGEQQGYGEPLKEGAELALHEFETFGGLPGAPGQNQRHLAMLICDHGADPLAVASHLIDEVKVPVIIGPGFSGVTINVFNEEAKRKGVLLLSPSATSPAISEQVSDVDNDLLWRTAPSDVVQAEVLKQLLARVEQALGLEHEDTRITVPVKSDAAGQGLANSYEKKADVPAPAKAVGGENLQRLEYGDPDKGPIDWPTHAGSILRFLPDVVFAAGTDEFVVNLLPQIEQNWPATEKDLPWYLLPEGDRTPPLIAYVNDHPEIASRIVGTAPGARTSGGYQAFASRFSALFKKQPGNLAEFAYDAVYLLSYAIAIAGKPFPNGPELGQALKNVTCSDSNKTQIVAEPNNFTRAFNAAARPGNCLDFDGVSGPLDFDPNIGEAPSDIAIWCLRQKNGVFNFDPPLDVYYSITASKLVEDPDAPLDFDNPNWCK